MDIGALSMSMSTAQLKTSVSVSLIDKVMGQQQEIMTNMISDMAAANMPAYPGHMDIRV